MRRALSAGVLLLSACSPDPVRCPSPGRSYELAGQCVSGAEAFGAIASGIVAVVLGVWLVCVLVEARSAAQRAAKAAEDSRKLLAELRDRIGD